MRITILHDYIVNYLGQIYKKTSKDGCFFALFRIKE